MTNVERSIQRYRTALADIETARAAWPDLRETLVHTLESVSRSCGITWTVEVNEVFTHRESVVANLGRRPSPFQFNPDAAYNRLMQNDRQLMKEHGALIFSQLPNGSISAWMHLPACEGITAEDAPTVEPLGDWSIEDVDTAAIDRTISAFFDRLAKWEHDEATSTDPIGFRFGAGDEGEG
ncbi:MAG: hypothetical protein ACO3YQ_06030 [Flavobacteriales bacterium]